MSIDKNILFEKIEKILKKFEFRIGFDKELVLWLTRKVLFNDPTKNCVVKGRKENWVGLPKSKSLFFSEKDRGLPIGNLTSQLFANIYLNDFDHFIKNILGCKYYGRYVDDLLFVHEDKDFLKLFFPVLDEYLSNNLFLHLHRKKFYLQHYSKGVMFLGRIILPYRVYIKNRTKGNAYKKLEEWIKISRLGEISAQQKRKAFCGFCSYYGMFEQANTFRLRRKIVGKLVASSKLKVERKIFVICNFLLATKLLVFLTAYKNMLIFC